MTKAKNKNSSALRKPVANIDNIEELIRTRHSLNVSEAHEEQLTFGDRIADRVAEIAGSWKFIISFILILMGWILVNSIQLLTNIFDPFPYILLNLVLSCIAALQAPVIMMSQNRQEKKDRIRAEMDYQTNLKAEIIVEALFNKLQGLEVTHQSLLQNQQEIKNIVLQLKRNHIS